MDHRADVDAGRRKAAAVDYLKQLLERRGANPLQQAEEIANLAFDRSNPVSVHFSAAASIDRPSTARPATAHQADGIKSSLSKFFGRGPSESKGLGSVSSVCNLQDQPPGTSPLYTELFGDSPFEKSAKANSVKKKASRNDVRASSSKSPVKPVPNNSVFSSSSRIPKPSSAYSYTCIVCQEQLSSKGVCKRHLEEQHVAPKVYKCEKCGERFNSKKEAKEHSNPCGQGVFVWTKGAIDDKKFYPCEFTGDCFLSKSKYVEHLLSLSERTENRPKPDPLLKLFAILDQAPLRQDVIEISCKMFGSRMAWRNLQWTGADLKKAINELDNAEFQENGIIKFGKNEKSVRIYLNSLFDVATLPRSNSQQSRRSRSSTVTTQRRSPHGSEDGRKTPTPSARSTMQPPMGPPRSVETSSASQYMPTSAPAPAPPPVPEAVIATMSAETRSKRHLSDQSRAFNPERQPPGPPLMSQIPYAITPSMPDLQYTLPNNNSMTSLPYRSHEGPNMVDQITGDMYSMRTASTATPTLSSDAASEMTLQSSYHEPEPLDQMRLEYYTTPGLWNNQQCDPNYTFDFNGNHGNHGNINYNIPDPQFFYTNNNPSARASSVATDQTYVVDHNDYQQKFDNFENLQHNTAQYGQTFFLDGDDDIHETHGLS